MIEMIEKVIEKKKKEMKEGNFKLPHIEVAVENPNQNGLETGILEGYNQLEKKGSLKDFVTVYTKVAKEEGFGEPLLFHQEGFVVLNDSNPVLVTIEDLPSSVMFFNLDDNSSQNIIDFVFKEYEAMVDSYGKDDFPKEEKEIEKLIEQYKNNLVLLDNYLGKKEEILEKAIQRHQKNSWFLKTLFLKECFFME